MEYDIYLDVFFFVNFTMNLILIGGCSRLMRTSFSFLRVICAAAFGAILAAIWFLFSWEMPGTRFLIALTMARIAYGKERIQTLFKRSLILFFAAFCLDGTVCWLLEGQKLLMNRLGLKGREGFFLLLAGGLLSMALLGLIKKETEKEQLLIPVRLFFQGKEKELTGLYDTGNELCEPITGRPVHIAEYEAVKELIPKSYQEVIEDYLKTGSLELTKVTKLKMYEFTFLSYHSIGNEKGQLLGIRMDSAVFFTKAGEKTEKKVVIGLSEQPLSMDGHYQLIINRRLGV